MFYFACYMNIIFNSLLMQLVKYDVHTACKIQSIHAIFYHILSLSCCLCEDSINLLSNVMYPV